MTTTPEVGLHLPRLNDHADQSAVRLLREELGLLHQPDSYFGAVVQVMGTKSVIVSVHPAGKYGMLSLELLATSLRLIQFSCGHR